jgi:hypothetical protein
VPQVQRTSAGWPSQVVCSDPPNSAGDGLTVAEGQDGNGFADAPVVAVIRSRSARTFGAEPVAVAVEGRAAGVEQVAAASIDFLSACPQEVAKIMSTRVRSVSTRGRCDAGNARKGSLYAWIKRLDHAQAALALRRESDPSLKFQRL